MQLTFKKKHGKDYTEQLRLAKVIAISAIETGLTSSKYYKHLGLDCQVSNQIARKYARNKKIKQVHHVPLVVPGQALKVIDGHIVGVRNLDIDITTKYLPEFTKVNQIEITEEYYCITVSVDDIKPYTPETTLGVDRNTVGWQAVCACPETGKVLKLGKSAGHLRNKYKSNRKVLQKKGKYKAVKNIKSKESRVCRDLNHKISKSIIDYAIKTRAKIVLEDLKGVRKAKSKKSFKGQLNNWSYYQLGMFIEYKAKEFGIPLEYVKPEYTSKCCSKCGCINNPQGKHFSCNQCGHIEHRDVNAGFNIALRSLGVQFGIVK